MVQTAATAFIPALLIAAICFAIGWVWRKDSPIPWDALGIGLAFLWGYLVINQIWLPNPQRGAIHWLPWVLVAGLGISLALHQKAELFRLVSKVLTVFLAYILIAKFIPNQPGSVWTKAVLFGLLIFLANYHSWRLKSVPLPAWDHFLAFGLTCAAAIPVFMIAGSSKWAQIIGLGGIICVPGFLIAVKTGVTLTRGASFLLTTIFWSITTYVFFVTSAFPFESFVILLVWGPIALLSLGFVKPGTNRNRLRVFLYSLLAFLLSCAVYFAFADAPEPSDYYGGTIDHPIFAKVSNIQSMLWRQMFSTPGV